MKTTISRAVSAVGLLSVLLIAPAAATAQTNISNLQFAIELADRERTQDPVWVGNGGRFVLEPGQQRALRAVGDSAGRRVYPAVIYTIASGADWLSFDDAHVNKGTVEVTARRGTGTNRSGVIEWRLGSGFTPADGVTHGAIEVVSGRGMARGAVATPTPTPTQTTASARQIVSDLYQAILLRDLDSGAQGWIDTVTRDGYDGVVSVARSIANSGESRDAIARRGVTIEQRLTAMYQYMQGRARRDVAVDEWDRNLGRLRSSDYEGVVLDLLWSDGYFRRTGLPRPDARPFASAAAVPGQTLDTRFRGLDRNNDGRVERTEWKGNDVSFANHDWNADGYLSGLEMQPAAAQSDEARARFAELDRNANGSVPRAEWPGRADDFDRLDRNRDNQLSRAEFENPPVAATQREERFRTLDRNRDARLRPDEWPGSDYVYAQLDANRDGQVSRDEYLTTSVNSRLQQFVDRDSNDDGVLVRGEWYSDTASFNRLDRNLDGVVSLEEFGQG